MLYVIQIYWPFLIVALVLGLCVGWWYQDPRSADDVTLWLEPGSEDR
jgi:hypothetical protein